MLRGILNILSIHLEIIMKILISLFLSLSCISFSLAATGTLDLAWNDPARSNRTVSASLYYPAVSNGAGAPPSPAPAGGFPLLVFGHGFLMVADRYTWLADELIPENMMVLLLETETSALPSHADFGLDLAFALESMLAEGDDPASLFFGLMGPALLGGHSMGGGASVLAAAATDQALGLLLLAPAETSQSAIEAAATITLPSLMLWGTTDCATPLDEHALPIHNALASPCKYLLELSGGSHCQFALPDTYCSLGELFCQSPGISRDTQLEWSMRLALPWMKSVLDQGSDNWQSFQQELEDPDLVIHESCNTPPVLQTPELNLAFMGGLLRFSWEHVPGAAGYRLYGRSLQSQTFSPYWQGSDSTVTLTQSPENTLFFLRAIN
jgi:pimeloyl-ACP methyl ester carboxylesterase